MSRRPGIGARWFDVFKGDCFPKDFITFNGHKIKPPVYYERLLEMVDPVMYEKIKLERRCASEEEMTDLRRLQAMEAVKHAQLTFLRREIEE